jgi:hypothetical protein
MKNKKTIVYSDKELISELKKKLNEVLLLYRNHGRHDYTNIEIDFNSKANEISKIEDIREQNIMAAITCLNSNEKVSVIVFKKLF